MSKKKLFIGSSSEEIKVAKKIKDLLKNDFQVTIWNEELWDKSIFKLNENFFSNLMEASLKYDFGILIGTSDDKVEIRGKEMIQARDNILFELGLFMGRLGKSRCAFLIEQGTKILSDMQGISLAYFEKKNEESLEEAVEKIKDMFLNSTHKENNFFPSVVLAVNYYENFIIPICENIITNNGFKFNGKEYNKGKCKVKIVIPSKISKDFNLQITTLKLNYEIKHHTFNHKGRPRNIGVDIAKVDDTIEFLDFPTTLSCRAIVK